MNSTDIFLGGSGNREISPVRWCDREVDGVYLGRSGWVQVQQRSLDENRRSNYTVNVSPGNSLQPSRRPDIKLVDYHFNSEPERKCPELNKAAEPQRPIYLPLHSREYERKSNTPSPHSVPESFSPPNITPILSPPPAFQDKTSKNSSKSRTFFGKAHFLPRSDAIEDSDGSPETSPKYNRKPIASSLPPPPHRKPKIISPLEQKQRSYPRIPQTKSLEDTTANRRTQFLQRYGESSSSSSSSMGFRSLDSYVPRPAMPRLSENTDSSVDVYEDADDEDNNSSSLNLSVVSSIFTSTITEPPQNRSREKVSPTNRSNRTFHHRPTPRRSPAGSDSNKHPNCASHSSSSSCEEFPMRTTLIPTQPLRRSTPARPFPNKSPQDDSASQSVRRSRSLQLPDKKIPVLHTSLSPQHPESQHRVPPKLINQTDRLKRHSMQSMKLKSLETDALNEDMLREAEVVTGFLYGSRSRAAAQALLIHRYNNSNREEKPKEPAKSHQNPAFDLYYVDNKQNLPQRGSTTPNLKNSKYLLGEIKNPCNSDTCDFWPHCAHRESLNSQAQSMMRLSQSYPSHHKSMEASIPDTNRSTSAVLERPSSEQYKKRISRCDTEPKSYARRMAGSTLLEEHPEVTDFKTKRRPSPNKSNVIMCDVSVEKKTSPVNAKSVVNRSPSRIGNSSSSSSTSDMYVTTSDRTCTKSPKNIKSSGASTPLEEMPSIEERPHEVIMTRPGSAPGDKNSSGTVESQQRSMSLPKSFLSASSQLG